MAQPLFPAVPLSPPATRSKLPAVDITGFFEAVNSALQLHIKTVGTPTGTQPTFVHSFPKERLEIPGDPFDVITFGVDKSQMAPTSNDGSRVPMGPQLRDSVASNKLFGYNATTIAWRELVDVRFTIWSKSNRRADDMVNWFHRFMMEYAYTQHFFRARGVDLFRFVERKPDEVDQNDRQEIYKRVLVYQIRIEYLQTLLDRQIQDVDLEIVPLSEQFRAAE